jgi:photosystem II stability/assembly factor-like uncharacterized protein
MKKILRTAAVILAICLFYLQGEAQTWRRLGPTDNSARIVELALPSQVRDAVYAVDPGIGGIYDCGGIFKSDNGGVSWTKKNSGLDVYPQNMAGGESHAYHIAIDPTSASICYVTVDLTYSFMSGPYSRIYKTTNGGEYWAQLIEKPGDWPAYRSKAFHCIAIDPLDHSRIYASATYGGVFKSMDGGATWNPIGTGLLGIDTLDLVINPNQTSQIFAGTSNGVFMSSDSGASWSVAGLASTNIQCLLRTSNSPVALYAGTAAGLFKSVDGAATWSAINTGLTNTDIRAVASDPGNPSAIYAGTYGGGVFKSADAGATWTAFNAGLWNLVVHCLAVDPNDPTRVYAGTDRGVFSTFNPPTLSIDRTSAFFGLVLGGSPPTPQSVYIKNRGSGTLSWTAVSPPWITVSPASAGGNGFLRMDVNPVGLNAGAYSGSITISDPGALNSPQSLNVELNVYAPGTTGPPFGYFDTPENRSSPYDGAIPVTGWALDDVEVTKVEIERDPHLSDPPGAIGMDGLVYIGDAIFVEGARPDVERTYPGFPLNTRAGWGYMILSNSLPNGGNGIFALHAFATDNEGNKAFLGTKTITCNNALSTKPFGTIDTPTQGGTAFGTGFVNFGWALTPLPKSIPIDGLTITAWVDGLPLGHPTYNNFRPDIASLFPGYANSNGAVGFYYLDTTSYLDGVHTIAWSVEDSDGAADGIGSRYFQILNTGSGSTVGGTRATISDMAGGTEAKIFGAAERTKATISDKTGYGKDTAKLPNVGIIGGTAFLQFRGGVRSIEEIQNMILDKASPVHVRRGYSFDRLAEPVFPNREGRIDVSISELERVAIYLDPAQAWETREELEARGCELRGMSIPLRSQSRLDFVAGTNDSRGDTIGENSDPGMKNAKNLGITGKFSPYPASVPAVNPRYSAYLIVGSELRPLPIGSTFDADRGVLYWQPGPGFLGDYDFVFVDRGRKTNKAVKIRIGLSRKSR